MTRPPLAPCTTENASQKISAAEDGVACSIATMIPRLNGV